MHNITEHPYWSKTIALGTKHKKEQVIRPQFLMQLGSSLTVPKKMDTDTLGTFSGEVERLGTAQEIAVRKAKWAMALTGLPFGLANEGSFGPHPEMGFIPSDTEWMAFVDQERDLTVVENLITTKTNFGHIVIQDLKKNAKRFLKACNFPSHGVIVRPHKSAGQPVLYKGIINENKLEAAIKACRKQSIDGLAQIETDMRAHMNPTRQFAIQMLAQKLAKRLRTLCSSCGSPGWGLLETESGLPCETCEYPTHVMKRERHGCSKCGTFEMVKRSDGAKTAPTQYCDACNP